MNVNAYLNFPGTCEEAFNFYAKCLNSQIVALLRAGDTPMKDHTPADRQAKIVHARMVIGDTLLMGSDAPPDFFKQAQGFSVCLSIPEVAEAERVFHALAEGGKVEMAIQETFWANRFGTLTDRYGTPWMINCEKPMG
jgi:PhnB protein